MVTMGYVNNKEDYLVPFIAHMAHNAPLLFVHFPFQ